MAASRITFDAAPAIDADATPTSARWLTFGRRAAWCVVAATVVALAFAAQNHASSVAEGFPASWTRGIRTQLLVWYTWTALIIPIVALVRRYPIERPRLLPRVGVWIVAGLVSIIIHTVITTTIAALLGWFGPPPKGIEPTLFNAVWLRMQFTIAPNLLTFVMIALAVHMDASLRAARAREMREARLAARLVEAELGALKMQLQPHFFFNTLNTVSSLMDGNVQRARTVLANLGDLLRLSMDRLGNNETQLGDEFEFLEKYLDIQRARYGARLQVELRLDPGLARAMVPSLILQPLVENAVRHAAEPRRGPTTIHVAAATDGGRLSLTVDDDGPGMAGARANGERRGVGLQNTEARLTQLYGAEQRLELLASPLGGLRVRIELPLRYHIATSVT